MARKRLYRDGDVPPEHVLRIIVGFMHRVARPVYLGTVALEVGHSLARTQEMMEALEDRGEARAVGADEKRRLGFREDANVYAVVGEPVLNKARF